MSPVNLAIVGLKLLAIYGFVQAIPLFGAFGVVTAVLEPKHFGASALVTLLPGGSLLALAIALFVFAVPLAKRLIPAPAAAAPETACTFEQLQALAFAVAGVLILTTSLPSLGRAVQDLHVMSEYQKQGGTNPADRVFSSWLYSAGVFAQLAVGALLLLYPKGFRNAWRYLRTAGT